mgnify:CR=1 FL=1
MLDPAIGKLIENYENRYRLVVDVAKEAREIAKKAEERGEIIIEKTVSTGSIWNIFINARIPSKRASKNIIMPIPKQS